jgi:hypothetical protein
MSPRRVVTFRPEEDLDAAMAALFERDGISQSEQIRRALRVWLEGRGVLAPAPTMKTARKRADTRKRA